ncbi:MAG: GPP34 family phosphoprotein [Draconibacterium sp.]
MESLTLSQKIYLLGIHPKKGGIISPAYTAMDYCILGALFLELYQLKKIKIINKRIVLIDGKTDNELYRFILEKIGRSEKSRRISHWVNKFYFSLKYIRSVTQHQLAQKKIIVMEQKRFLFFTWNTPYIYDKQFVTKFLTEVEKQILQNPSSETEIFLLSFIKPAGLIRRIFPEREKRRQAGKRLTRLMNTNPVSIAVADSIAVAKAVTQSISTVSASHNSVT